METLDSLLNMFMNDPYDKKYEKTYNPYKGDIAEDNIFSKKIVGRKNKYIINEEYSDISAFAIKSLYHQPMRCYLFFGKKHVSTTSFYIEPNEIIWIFQGIPLLFRHFKYTTIELIFMEISNVKNKFHTNDNIFRRSNLLATTDIEFLLYYSFLPQNYIYNINDLIIYHYSKKFNNLLLLIKNGIILQPSLYHSIDYINDIKITFYPKKDLMNNYHILMQKANTKCLLFEDELFACALHPNRIFANYCSNKDNFSEYMNQI